MVFATTIQCYVNRWSWLCSSNALFKKTDWWAGFVPQFAYPCFKLLELYDPDIHGSHLFLRSQGSKVLGSLCPQREADQMQ